MNKEHLQILSKSSTELERERQICREFERQGYLIIRERKRHGTNEILDFCYSLTPKGYEYLQQLQELFNQK